MKTSRLLIIAIGFILFSSITYASDLDYTLSTTFGAGGTESWSVTNLNDKAFNRDSNDATYFNPAINGTYFGMVFNQTFNVTRIGFTGLEDGSSAVGDFDYEIFINNTSVWNGSYTDAGPPSAINLNTTITGTVGASINMTFHFNQGISVLVKEVFAYGNYLTSPPSSLPYYDFDIVNLWNSSKISGANITLNSSESRLSDANGNATFYNLTDGNRTYTVNLTNYFNMSGEIAVNETETVNMYQSIISFNCLEKITNTSLTCINNTNIYPNAGTYNFTIGVNNYYDVTQEEIITALDNKTINFYNFSNSWLNVSAYNIRTNATISNYTLIITDLNNLWNTTIIADGLYINETLISGRNYSVEINAIGYEYKTVNFTNFTSQNYNFSLYTANSVLINIFEEDGGARIYENITIRFEDLLANIDEYITNTSIQYVDNLSVTNYTVSFISDNYSTRTYTITVGNNTFQTLNAYLIDDGAGSTIFEFNNKNTGASLEGVTLTIQKLINATWTIVEVLTSDITGRTSFDYLDDEAYKFIASLTGYTTKTFTLDPILFSSYTINLEPTITEVDYTDYSGVNIYYTPSIYYDNANNTITFTFISPYGEFVSYGFNATYGATTVSNSGVNAYGSIITAILNITGASFGDTVVVKYNYVLSDGDSKEYTRVFSIDGSSATTGTLLTGLKTDYGLGIFEKMLIAVGLTILIAGAGAYFGGGITAGVLGALILGIFGYTGFIPLWSIILSVVIIFIILSWRSTL